MKLEEVKKLHQKKYRAQFGYYLVEGEHLLLELAKVAHSHFASADVTVYVSPKYYEWMHALNTPFSIIVLDNKQMLSLSDTKSPQGIIACVPLPTVAGHSASIKPNTRYVYLHEVQDPGNLGTIIRTLGWFGNFRLLLSANCVDPFNSKVVRASMGAIFHVPVEQNISLGQLPQRFTKFAFLDMQGAPVNSPQFVDYDCYLFGNEARGVPCEELSGLNAQAFTIKGGGGIDSLNLANAVAICAFQLSS